MKPEAQRIAIAEVCGWHNVRPNPVPGILPLAGTTKPDPVSDSLNPLFGIPDYLNSLDAMVAVEAIIGDAETQIRYAANVLIEMGFPDLHEAHDLNVDYCWHALGASPKERAKAFLRTLNLWTE